MPFVDSDVERPTSRRPLTPAASVRSRREAPRAAAGLVLSVLLLALATVAPTAGAQGMGGGMGGMGGGGGRGGRGGGRGGRSGDDSPVQRGPSGDDVAKQMNALASLDQALRDVPDLDHPQKDSLKAIETRYGRIFESYGIAARTKVDSARAAGGTPSMDDLRELRVAADSVRAGEFALARAVLSTEEQRARFDANVADIQAEEAKRRGTRGQRSAGGAGRGGA